MVLVFLYHDALHLCEVSSGYLERLPTYRADTSIIEMAIFSIYYVQRAATPKVVLPELRFLYSACCLMVL